MTDEQRAYVHLTIFGSGLAILGLTFLAAVVWHWHATHPRIDMPLPKTIEQIQTPPAVRAWRCGSGPIHYGIENPDADRCVPYDPKG